MNKEKLQEGAYSITKGVIGSIPVAGSLAAEVFSLLVSSPLEKRRDAWMNDVSERLTSLEKDPQFLEKLKEDEEFIDILIEATRLAIKTSKEEKRTSFANAVVNAALGQAPDTATSQIFLSLLDQSTEWHIKFLHYFTEPNIWFFARKTELRRSLSSTVKKTLYQAFPEAQKAPDLTDFVINDLIGKKLLNSVDINAMVTFDGTLIPQATEFGRRFLTFIALPDEKKLRVQ